MDDNRCPVTPAELSLYETSSDSFLCDDLSQVVS